MGDIASLVILAPYFYLFWSLQHFLSNKKFDNSDGVQNFYTRCQEVVSSESCYFIDKK